MAATGYTPISLYYSATAGHVPTAGNLVNGELAINIADGVLFYKNAGGVVTSFASGATITNDTTTSTAVYPLFANVTSGAASTLYTSNANYLYTPSTGTLVAPILNASNGIVMNATTLVSSTTIPTGSSAESVGADTGFTIPSGLSVTVSSGSRWVII